jgi:hypothetical protein
MQPLAYFTGYAQDLLAIFILLNWVRVLKYMRLFTPAGPLVQSVIDTIKARTVVVFILLLVCILKTYYVQHPNIILLLTVSDVVLICALVFHIAFGNDIQEYNYYGHSLYEFLFIILIFA